MEFSVYDFQIQLLLSEYLDIKNTEKSRQQAPSSFDEQNTDIGIYFAKKRPQKPKKVKEYESCSLFVISYVSACQSFHVDFGCP